MEHPGTRNRNINLGRKRRIRRPAPSYAASPRLGTPHLEPERQRSPRYPPEFGSRRRANGPVGLAQAAHRDKHRPYYQRRRHNPERLAYQACVAEVNARSGRTCHSESCKVLAGLAEVSCVISVLILDLAGADGTIAVPRTQPPDRWSTEVVRFHRQHASACPAGGRRLDLARQRSAGLGLANCVASEWLICRQLASLASDWRQASQLM